MNFKEAYKAMQEGKNVRRKSWKKNEFIDVNYNDKFVFTSIENALAEDWEVVEEKKKYWIPEEEEKYFAISNKGDIAHCINKRIEIAQAQSEIGNCFKTEEEAEHRLEKIKVIHELKKFAYENNEREIDWNNFSQNKFCLIYDYEDEEICIDYYSYSKNNPFNIYFTSNKIAIEAIKTIGEDRIKKYYFDVEE